MEDPTVPNVLSAARLSGSLMLPGLAASRDIPQKRSPRKQSLNVTTHKRDLFGISEPARMAYRSAVFGENSTSPRANVELSYSIADRSVSLVRRPDSAWLPPTSEALGGSGATRERFGGCLTANVRKAPSNNSLFDSLSVRLKTLQRHLHKVTAYHLSMGQLLVPREQVKKVLVERIRIGKDLATKTEVAERTGGYRDWLHLFAVWRDDTIAELKAA
jgi:hypothetical protein